MKLNFFWNDWDKPYRIIYVVFLSILVLAMLSYAVAYFLGSSLVIQWELENTIKSVPTVWESFWIGIYKFPITVENYLVSQNFTASGLQVNVWPAYVVLIWMAVFLSVVLALIPKLSRFWFVISVALFTLLLIGLKLEYLMLFNSFEKYGIAIGLALYYPLLYLFHFLRPNASINVRIASFFVATMIFAIIIYQFSNVPFPFLHLANYGIYVPLIITILFCFMVGHEIVSGLLAVISGSGISGEKGGLYHFLIISVVFLVNVALVLFKNSRIFDWNLYLIGAFGLLTISTIIGIWGYRWREITYESTYPFFPTGAILYLLLAVTAHITIAYFFITGNDALVESVEDAIVFSQLGFSAMFIVYFLANFYDIMRENGNVAKIIFKPRRMPYFTSRFAALIVVLGIFLRLHMTAYNQAVAGFYAGIGDLYMKSKDVLAAREYYNLANMFSGTGHRRNFAMATLEHLDNKTSEEIRYLKQAIGKNPTPFAYALLASRLSDEKKYFEAMFTLKDGLNKFPEDGRLMNNLGLIYTELGETDSAFQAFDNALKSGKSHDVAGANVYALLRQEGMEVREDTLSSLLNNTTYLPANNNLVVLANAKGERIDDQGMVNFGTPKKTTIDQVIYNYNKTLNDPSKADSAYFSQMTWFYDSTEVTWFEDQVRFAGALAQFRQGNMADAMIILSNLALQNPEREYFATLGNLAASLGAWELAIDHYKNSFQNGHLQIAPQLAFAYMEAGQLDKAEFLWKQIQAAGDSSNERLASKMIGILQINNIDDVLYGDESDKLAYIKYKYQKVPIEKLDALALSIDNPNIRALALLKLFDLYMDLGNITGATEVLVQLGELNLSEERIVDEINVAQCRFAYTVNDTELMQKLVNNLERNQWMVTLYLHLFEIKSGTRQDYDTLAKKQLVPMALRNPFFEPGVAEAVNFLNNKAKNNEEAYSLVLKAANINPYSKRINQLYAIQCLKVGLREYALNTREELRLSMGEVSFNEFNLEFEKELSIYEAKRSDWQ